MVSPTSTTFATFFSILLPASAFRETFLNTASSLLFFFLFLTESEADVSHAVHGLVRINEKMQRVVSIFCFTVTLIILVYDIIDLLY